MPVAEAEHPPIAGSGVCGEARFQSLASGALVLVLAFGLGHLLLPASFWLASFN